MSAPHMDMGRTVSCHVINGKRINIVKESVVNAETDVIVNCANSQGLGGGGVDGAISKAGGNVLYEARKHLWVNEDGERIPCGDAKATVGGDLEAGYCIHAVGPNYSVCKDNPDGKLWNAYKATMREAQALEARTIAFSLISAGVFKGNNTLEHVLGIGVDSILDNYYNGLNYVHMYCFSDEEVKALSKIMKLYN
tara:strand:+ start:166 stop:750 length:585 start_codon:yes stop_codon:yes gene_type:complete